MTFQVMDSVDMYFVSNPKNKILDSWSDFIVVEFFLPSISFDYKHVGVQFRYFLNIFHHLEWDRIGVDDVAASLKLH